MDHTPFAGLTEFAPGESPWGDGGSFFGRNILTIDRLLRIGAKLHRHDGLPGLDDPPTAPAANAFPSGGGLPPDLPVHIVVTAIDDSGGETLPSPETLVTTPEPLAGPNPPVATADYTAGDLPANTYYYVLTYTDGAGGETPTSDPAIITLEAGHANGSVHLDIEALADGWRLYRSVNGGSYGFLAAGSTASYVDDTSDAADPQLPPPDDATNTTGNAASITVTVSDLPADAVSYRLYANVDPSFPSPSLLGEWPAAEAATARYITTPALLPGQPPIVSTSIGGAPLLDIRWKDPVATAGDLPTDATNTVGDVRLSLDDMTLHGWGADDAWHNLGGPTIDGNPVTAISLAGGINTSTNAPGDITMWTGLRGLSSDDFESAGTLSDPSYISQNLAVAAGPFDPGVFGALQAAAAAADGRIAVDPTAAPSLAAAFQERSSARFVAVVADDEFGTSVKVLDIDNFVLGRVNNATGAAVLELATMDANVETVLASKALPAVVTGQCWLRTEIMGGFLGVALYTMNPELTIATPDAFLGFELTGAANAKFGAGITGGYGLRMIPAAGNTLLVTDWAGAGS